MVSRTRKIVWSSKSLQDKKNIFSYWNNRNKSTLYSRKLDVLFDKKILQVSENPFIGRKTSLENVRTVVVRGCLLIYEIFPDTVLISGVWEGHQNPRELDFENLL